MRSSSADCTLLMLFEAKASFSERATAGLRNGPPRKPVPLAAPMPAEVSYSSPIPWNHRSSPPAPGMTVCSLQPVAPISRSPPPHIYSRVLAGAAISRSTLARPSLSCTIAVAPISRSPTGPGALPSFSIAVASIFSVDFGQALLAAHVVDFLRERRRPHARRHARGCRQGSQGLGR